MDVEDLSSSNPQSPFPPLPQPSFGLVVPGARVQTAFVPVDASGLKFTLTLSAPGDLPIPVSSVTELVCFLLPGVSLPPHLGVLFYWQVDGISGFEVLGALTTDQPSGVFRTAWSEHEQLMAISNATSISVTIGVALEPITNLQNLGDTLDRNKNTSRLFVAQKIATDLFHFMQSFDTGSAHNGNMLVPTNIFDRWYQRFEKRFQRDPNFFLKSND